MRKLKGIVTSDKMQKTVGVRVDRLKKHPKYGKYFRTTQKFKAHDEKGEYKIGDLVIIQETRPLSKDKRWRAVSLVKRGIVETDEKEESSDANPMRI
ncbi:MAG: 30S ribosomal protein S17 [Candidatus Sungbacteria bacterium]|nr:30S ribosomal protein S17 [Candidatus Sungbacteria bacterium]